MEKRSNGRLLSVTIACMTILLFQNCAPSNMQPTEESTDLGSLSTAATVKAQYELFANEHAEIRDPMVLEKTQSSPTGYRVFAKEANKGSAIFEFNLDSSRSYQVELLTLADTSSRNSIKISVNGEAARSLELSVASSYQWNTLPNIYKEAAGKQRISIAGAEAYVRVASVRLKIQSDSISPNPTPTPTPSATPTPTVTPTPSNPTASKAPGENFDLTLWKITLPIDKNGGFTGTAMEVSPIAKTYSQKDYFYTAADGAMVFAAPTTGATTSGSHYPRSELREMIAGNKPAAWTIATRNELNATVAVNEVPTTSAGAKGRVVVGQIHGPDDELCRLYYDNGVIYYYNDKAGSNGTTETKYELKNASGAKTNIPLNSKFSYQILIEGGKQRVSVVYNGETYSSQETIGSFWPGKALYFKAGVYVQVGKAGSGAGTTGTGQGKVSFYALERK